ncbi:hypothetical protein, partial [uncultured Proteiniphilum sp.]|uniref:hypothetical protein n=1 Tax=uncultured Proteiniphilum sp. TaxID=497637 RepID=UPI00262AD9EA
SDAQFKAVSIYLASGGKAWLALPFGTFDEKGNKRATPLSDQLTRAYSKRITVIDSALNSDPLAGLIQSGKFSPIIRQTGGDERWAARIRFYDGEFTMHFMNTAMKPVPHQDIEDNGGVPIIQDIDSSITNNQLSYEIRINALPDHPYLLKSPELKDKNRKVISGKGKKGHQVLDIDLSGIKIYGALQKG